MTNKQPNKTNNALSSQRLRICLLCLLPLSFLGSYIITGGIYTCDDFASVLYVMGIFFTWPITIMPLLAIFFIVSNICTLDKSTQINLGIALTNIFFVISPIVNASTFCKIV